MTGINNYYAYKRIDHFNEVINQFNNDRNLPPDEVMDKLRNDFVQDGIDLAQLNSNTVKIYLKRNADLHYNRYYDTMFHIAAHFHGRPLPIFDEDQKNNLRWLFQQAISVWNEICNQHFPGRFNFLGYNFVIYKMCQFFGYHEFLDYFPRLKSQAKRKDSDKAWRLILEKLELSPEQIAGKKITAWWRSILAHRRLVRLRIAHELEYLPVIGIRYQIAQENFESLRN